MQSGEVNPLSRYLDLWKVIEQVSIAVPRMVTCGAPNAINSVTQCADSVSRPAGLASPVGVHRARSLRTHTHPSPSPSVRSGLLQICSEREAGGIDSMGAGCRRQGGSAAEYVSDGEEWGRDRGGLSHACH